VVDRANAVYGITYAISDALSVDQSIAAADPAATMKSLLHLHSKGWRPLKEVYDAVYNSRISNAQVAQEASELVNYLFHHTTLNDTYQLAAR